jgi:hypothetical protein
MVRLICTLVLVLLITTPSLGQQSLVGTYKLLSLVVDVDGVPIEQMGKAPQGYLVFTPTHFIAFVTAENRKFGTSVAEKAALFDTLVAYAGVYHVEGNKLIYTNEITWGETGKGKTYVEKFELSGNRLTKTLGPMPWPRDPSKTMIRREVCEKVE